MNRYHPILQCAFIALVFLLPWGALAQNGSNARFDPSQSTYIWPTNAGNYLSSTFGETRSAHFHSALDLKTWGRKGYKVFATRDGILHRIAIGPTGYGKVLYLKHDDGSYSVYAHLLRFEESIQQLADSIRFRDYSFEIDRNVEHLNIKVKQGDVIALSGASGIGPPHLHFELRTPEHRPFNPLLTNLKVNDSIAPQFSNISVEPLSIHSEIEGANRIYTKRAWKRNGRYTFGTIDVKGPVGLGVDVFDQADDVYNAYAVYELKMYVDGELRHFSKVDSFSYYETNQMFVDRVYPILQATRAGYQRLFIADGNTLPFYQRTNKSGKLDLSPGPHEVTIIAKDYFGNTSEATLRLRVAAPDSLPVHSPKQEFNKDTSIAYHRWNWFENWVNIPHADYSTITIAELGLDFAPDMQTVFAGDNETRVKLNPARDIYFRNSSSEHFVSRQILPGTFSIVPSTMDESFAAFQGNTFYDTLSVGLQVFKFETDSVKVQVFPESHPLKKEYRLAIEMDSLQQGIPNLGLYRFDRRRGKLSYLTSRRKGDYLLAEPEELGTFYVLRDTAPPLIGNPRLVQRTDGQWLVYVTVVDDRSGIDYTKSKFYVNGTRGIAEYEPEDDRLVYYHPDFSPDEQNEIKVIVADKEGHSAESTFELPFGKDQN